MINPKSVAGELASADGAVDGSSRWSLVKPRKSGRL
jgi:hypothetical protein